MPGANGSGRERGSQQAQRVTEQYRPNGQKPALSVLGPDATLSDYLTYALLNQPKVILEAKKRLDEAIKSLPADVTYPIAYDRSALIQRAVKTLQEKLIEESAVVALVCVLFLLHLRSALVAIVILPLACSFHLWLCTSRG
jgi:Cu/Ag efflux pump CusA